MAASEKATKEAIEQIIECLGLEKDRSGQPGISEKQVDDFFQQAEAHERWWKKAEADTDNVLPFSSRTLVASKSFNRVKGKVNDHCTRCRIAGFDARAANALNPTQVDYEALSPNALSLATEELAAFPLATVEAAKPLPLATGVNPAWAEAINNLTLLLLVFIFLWKEGHFADWSREVATEIERAAQQAQEPVVEEPTP